MLPRFDGKHTAVVSRTVLEVVATEAGCQLGSPVCEDEGDRARYRFGLPVAMRWRNRHADLELACFGE